MTGCHLCCSESALLSSSSGANTGGQDGEYPSQLTLNPNENITNLQHKQLVTTTIHNILWFLEASLDIHLLYIYYQLSIVDLVGGAMSNSKLFSVVFKYINIPVCMLLVMVMVTPPPGQMAMSRFCMRAAALRHQQEVKLVRTVTASWCGSDSCAWISEISLAWPASAASRSPFSSAVMLATSSSTSLSDTCTPRPGEAPGTAPAAHLLRGSVRGDALVGGPLLLARLAAAAELESLLKYYKC